MLYINDPDAKPMLYTDLVNMAIKSGIEPQRAYLYLASLGIRGELTRIIESDNTGYGKPVKLAIKGENTTITGAKPCKSCGALHIV